MLIAMFCMLTDLPAALNATVVTNAKQCKHLLNICGNFENLGQVNGKQFICLSLSLNCPRRLKYAECPLIQYQFHRVKRGGFLGHYLAAPTCTSWCNCLGRGTSKLVNCASVRICILWLCNSYTSKTVLLVNIYFDETK